MRGAPIVLFYGSGSTAFVQQMTKWNITSNNARYPMQTSGVCCTLIWSLKTQRFIQSKGYSFSYFFLYLLLLSLFPTAPSTAETMRSEYVLDNWKIPEAKKKKVHNKLKWDSHYNCTQKRKHNVRVPQLVTGLQVEPDGVGGVHPS